MRAHMIAQELHACVPRHRALVSVVIEKDQFRRVRVPRCEHLRQQAHRGRSQNAVRPDDLRPRARRPIALGFLLETLIRDEAAAAHARRARHREDHLAADEKSIPAQFVHVHADVDIGDEMTARETLELLALLEPVDRANDDVAALEIVGRVAPVGLHGDDPGLRVKPADQTLGDRHLGHADRNIGHGPADQPVGVRLFDDVRIDVHIPADAHMRRLLRDMRAAAAQTDNADRGGVKDGVAVSAKEALAIEARHAALQCRMAPFGHALVELARHHPDVVGMTADLAKYTDLHIFAQAYPDRFYQMGMAEQLLMGAAAGMAREGFMPFATTYAVFASRRAYDFICMAIAEENLNVKIVCALPGLTTGYGPSHQATEDLAIFRGLPNMTILDPCDAIEIEQAVPAIAAHTGPVYMRLLRGKVPIVLDKFNYQFEIGKAQLLVDGSDVLFISSGLMTMRALEATAELTRSGTQAAVLHVGTIKPLDVETILREAMHPTRTVVVAENHTVVGGLGEAVSRLLLLNGFSGRFRHIGLPDEFLDAGALPTLHDRYGISTSRIVKQVNDWLE